MRKTNKFLCVILAFIIILSYLTTSYADEVSDLNEQHNMVEEQLKRSNEELNDVKNELSENLQQVQKIDEKIEESEKQEIELKLKVNKLKQQIAEIQEKLNVAEKKYEKQKKFLESRLITIYESGDTQYLDVVLKSRNMSDFLSNYFLITELATYDTELLEDLEAKKKVIDISKQKLENSKKELSDSLRMQTKISIILQNTKTMRENFISKLSEQEKQIQSQIDEYMLRYNAINSEILKLTGSLPESSYIGGVLAWPVPGYTKISSNYGMRYHPILRYTKLHTGVDISAPMGANFVAANDGVVVKAELNPAYGNMVIIDHGGGISTLYAHGSEILVHLGQTVKRNETVLKVGSTGYSTGPHAHFEVRINGQVTNPMEYITNGVIPTNTDNQNTTNETKETDENAKDEKNEVTQ